MKNYKTKANNEHYNYMSHEEITVDYQLFWIAAEIYWCLNLNLPIYYLLCKTNIAFFSSSRQSTVVPFLMFVVTTLDLNFLFSN